MIRLASLLPEPDVVMVMYSAGRITGPQFMVEIDNVRYFTHKGALVAFADMDVLPFQSGTFGSNPRRISKCSSSYLRNYIIQITSTILRHSGSENPIFQFMDKKRAEVKH